MVGRDSDFVSTLVTMAWQAGREIMAHYRRGVSATKKADNSPVTEADRAAEALILTQLEKLAPGIPVLAEEKAASGDVPDLSAKDTFFLVDPLDGTKEFLRRNGEFTVNIALVERAMPRFGLVYAPALGRLYVTEAEGKAVMAEVSPDAPALDWTTCPKKILKTRKAPEDGLAVVASRSHMTPETEAFLAQFPVAHLRSAGSSLKFCLVAAGEADLYPRFGRTMEWDTAAGHAIVLAAGGVVLTQDGAPLTYGKADRGYDNPPFIVWGQPPHFSAD